MSAFIYLITNTVNSKCYIGQTINSVDDRFKGHCSDARAGSTGTLHKAIRKYGKDSFIVEVLEILEDLDTKALWDKLDVREIFYIDTLKPEYNIMKGGSGRVPIVPRMAVTNGLITRHIQKDSLIPEGFIRGISDITKAKIGLGNKGKVRTPEMKANISKAGIGRITSNETRLKLSAVSLGRIHTDETRAKMSAAGKVKTFSAEHRAKMSLAKIGKARPPFTDETRAKMSAAQRASAQKKKFLTV
jgi:group I intron endonuclease